MCHSPFISSSVMRLLQNRLPQDIEFEKDRAVFLSKANAVLKGVDGVMKADKYRCAAAYFVAGIYLAELNEYE